MVGCDDHSEAGGLSSGTECDDGTDNDADAPDSTDGFDDSE